MTELLECDMVMKGGITSGVVYPSAVADLSATYRLRNVGGASAGAIAAAAAAAAEYNRAGGGFDKLRALPEDLATDLQSLFHPAAELAPVFTVALDALAAKKVPIRGVVGLAAHPRTRVWLVVLGVLLCGAVAMFWVSGWAGAFGLAAWLIVVALIVVKLIVDLARLATRTVQQVNANNFGFCDGQTRAPGYPDEPAPLTQWLTELFNDLAGLPVDQPLTFGHLWGDEAVRLYREALQGDAQNPPPHEVVRARVIDLRVMATNVSMGRPYTMPLDTRQYMWCEQCLGRYFNDDVIRSMKECPSGAPAEAGRLCPVHGTQLWRFPAAPDLPVVVAVRISLSFPVLFSAVPLHIVDRSRAKEKQDVRICWFADGGIASNFPLHLFDSMWPRRPTFGISLGPDHPDYSAMVYRPSRPQDGINLRIGSIDSIVGFLGATMRAMQNWTDSLQRTQPGYRDRVVEIQTADSEGGLNIAMTPEQIRRLAERGSEAAGEFSKFDFDSHQWIRYRSAMSEMSRLFESMHDAWTDPQVSIQRLLVPGYTPAFMPPGSKQWSVSDAAATAHLLTTIEEWLRLGLPAMQSSPPRPSPQVRLTPRA